MKISIAFSNSFSLLSDLQDGLLLKIRLSLSHQNHFTTFFLVYLKYFVLENGLVSSTLALIKSVLQIPNTCRGIRLV